MNFYESTGEPIPDIQAWAKERGEAMVKGLFTPEDGRPPYEVEMPESFWSVEP